MLSLNTRTACRDNPYHFERGNALLWVIILWIAAAGCLGGFTNAILSGELQLPKKDEETNVYRPGWIGNVIIGGIAALVFWGLYGPFSNAALVGEGADMPISLKIGELFGSVVTGIGGGRLLMNEVDKKALRNQNEALVSTKNDLTDAVDKLEAE